jgi:pyrophosphatase PpaX
VIVAFEDYVHPKPDPEPLVMAARQLDARPEKSVYIGDAVVDILAAKAAGMWSVAIGDLDKAGADVCVRTLGDVRDAIGRINLQLKS